jgi:hypothetical protein
MGGSGLTDQGQLQVFPKRYLDVYAKLAPPAVAANPFPPARSPFVAWGGVMQEISEYTNIVAAKRGNVTQVCPCVLWAWAGGGALQPWLLTALPQSS